MGDMINKVIIKPLKKTPKTLERNHETFSTWYTLGENRNAYRAYLKKLKNCWDF